jgi:hypothetical protein
VGNLDGKSEVLQAVDEPVDVPALTPFVEVIGTEVFIEGSALQHVMPLVANGSRSFIFG